MNADNRIQSPLVSVVMAVYNGEPYLEEAMESILNQTFRDFEFVIVDDGSTDDSWRTLKRCADRDARVELLRNPQNRGLIPSLNDGIAASRGELVARMDADDISDVTRLEKQVDFLDRYPEVGLLGIGYERLYGDGRRTRHRPPRGHTEIRWRLLFGNIWPHPAVMFRRKFLRPGEACYGEYVHAEDYELWVRLSQRTRCATLPESLMTIRTHDTGGISAAHSHAQDEMVLAISADQIETLLPGEALEPSQARALDRVANPHGHEAPDLEVALIVLRIFNAFARRPGIEDDAVIRLRRSWVRRILAVSYAVDEVGPLLRSKFLRAAIREDPLAVLPRRRR